MRIYAVDDEPLALRLLENAVRAVAPESDLTCFSHPDDLISAARQQPCDVAFLDIRMYDVTGLDVARELRSFDGARNVIFVTGYDSYAREAFDVFASGYVLKPVCEDDVKNQLTHLRNPVEKPFRNHVEVRTFGSFEVFVDGVPVAFKRSKSKEILAILVLRRGARVSADQLESLLWNRERLVDSRRGYVSVLVSELRKSLANAGAESILRPARGGFSVEPDAFTCDYYQLLEGDEKQRLMFSGEFMSQYDWAQSQVEHLQKLIEA